MRNLNCEIHKIARALTQGSYATLEVRASLLAIRAADSTAAQMQSTMDAFLDWPNEILYVRIILFAFVKTRAR